MTDHLHDGPPPLEYVPPPARLAWWRRILARLPGFCAYCGRRYRRCSIPPESALMPIPHHGRCCPDSHEGYIDVFRGYGFARQWTDNVKAREAES
jgi:hypothetical protein